LPTVNSVIPSSAAAPANLQESAVTPEPAADTAAQVPPPPEVLEGQVVHREERIEYRDADGNILDEDDVELLKGKVSFEVSSQLQDTATIKLIQFTDQI
jgi:dolichyl-phosphate-mannose-protein mannosyltransferase